MELLRNITLGQYVPGTSVVHRLDPRAKVGIVVVAKATTFSSSHLVPLAVLGIATVLAAAASGLRVGWFVRGLRPIALLALLTFVFNALLIHGGEPLLKIGRFTVSSEGVRISLVMTLRLLLLYLVTSLFTLTTSPIRLTDALESLLSPLRLLRIRTAELSMMVSIALRFIPTLVDATEKIMKAQLSRGARFDEGSALARTRALVPVLVPLFVQAFHAADVLAEAMESRCYRGGSGRTRLVKLEARPLDLVCVLLVGALAIGIRALDALPLP
jgi:energy-coupling factor transport system permease protein